MEERGFFVNRRGQRLYYCLHRAQGAKRGWVFCNPFLEEKVFSHPVYVSFARRLAAQGEAVLRFDYAGDGDSEGELPAVGIEDWIADIVDAAALLREKAPVDAVGLFGLRLGADLALRAAQATRAQRALLWEPIADGSAYFQECLRINLTTQLAVHKKVVENREQMMERLRSGDTVNIQGHEVSARLADGIAGLRLAELLDAAPCPVDVVAIRTSARARAAAGHAGDNARVSRHACDAPPFWGEGREYDAAPEALFRNSLEALQRNAP